MSRVAHTQKPKHAPPMTPSPDSWLLTPECCSSSPDVARVEAASHGGILRSLHDHAAVREYGQFECFQSALQQEFIGEHGAQAFEPDFEFLQVESPRFGLVNLNRVAAAHADVGRSALIKISKLVLNTNSALRITARLNSLEMVAPQIARQERPVQF